MNKKHLSLFGLKFHPFRPDIPIDAIYPVAAVESFCRRVEFTLGDKFIYFGNLTWTIGWFSVFIFATIYNLTHEVSDDSWATFWWVKVVITVFLGVGTTIWFLFGGVRDIRALFATLATMKRDHRDDGRVVDHHNVSDEPLEEEATEMAE